MATRAAMADVSASVIAVCREGLTPDRLKAEVLVRLRRVIPIDALWWATSDPSTLLFTQAMSEGIPYDLIPHFVDNEFHGRDVNQWTSLASDRVGVTTLTRATGGDLDSSARYRDLLQPMGLGDELRAVLRTGDACWGLLCLHRQRGPGFSDAEQQLVRTLAPHLAEALRAGLLMVGATQSSVMDAPGLVILDRAGELIAATAPAQAWFAELGYDPKSRQSVPAEIVTAAALLDRPTLSARPADSAVPRLRVRTPAGRWAVMHASWLSPEESSSDQIAVIIEAATPIEVAEVIMLAYGLTERERTVTKLICQGQSTAQIATRLWITPNTVQDHLKSIFDKTGVHSRREVMARILRDHYLPGLLKAQPVGPTGYFS